MSKPAAPPPDPYAGIRQQELAMAQQERADRLAKEEARKKELATMRESATGAARTGAQSYFQQRGLDPTTYAGDIDTELNRILSTIAPDDPNPGAYLDTFGEDVYNSRQNTARDQALHGVDSLFTPRYAETRIANTFDDPFIASIESEQRQSADAIIQNMLARGVITPTGFNSAKSDLDRQSSGVRTQLGDIGSDLLDLGRDKLSGVADKGRSAASNLRLGDAFDASVYGGEADQIFNEFVSSFGDQFRTRIPKNLFETAGLGAIAGAGQQAQNTAFDPAALAGVIEANPEDPKKKKQTEAIF